MAHLAILGLKVTEWAMREENEFLFQGKGAKGKGKEKESSRECDDKRGDRSSSKHDKGKGRAREERNERGEGSSNKRDKGKGRARDERDDRHDKGKRRERDIGEIIDLRDDKPRHRLSTVPEAPEVHLEEYVPTAQAKRERRNPNPFEEEERRQLAQLDVSIEQYLTQDECNNAWRRDRLRVEGERREHERLEREEQMERAALREEGERDEEERREREWEDWDREEFNRRAASDRDADRKWAEGEMHRIKREKEERGFVSPVDFGALRAQRDLERWRAYTRFDERHGGGESSRRKRSGKDGEAKKASKKK